MINFFITVAINVRFQMTRVGRGKHLRNVIIGPQEQVPLFFSDEAVDVVHIPGRDGHASQATFLVEGNVLSPAVVIDPFGRMDHDTAGEGAAVGVFESVQTIAGAIALSPFPRDFETADGRTVAAGDVAENGRLGGTSLPRAVHSVAGIDHPGFLEGPDKQARLPARDRVVQEQAVVIVEPLPMGVLQGFLRPDFQLGVSGIARNATRAEQAAIRGGECDGSED